MTGTGEGRVRLAIETSGPLASVALRHGGRSARRFLLEPGAQARDLLSQIEALLTDVSARPSDIQKVIVGAGPGSFTGARVGASFALGLAHGGRVALASCSSLAAAAVGDVALPMADRPPTWLGSDEPPRDGVRCVVFDARGERVYAAVYGIEDGVPEEIVAPHASDIDRVLGSVPPESWFAGDAALRHADRIRSAGFRVLPAPAGFPHADGLLQLKRRAPGFVRGVERGDGWEPEYLKPSSAVPHRGLAR